MATDEESKIRSEAQISLERMQNFDPNNLPRLKELGDKFNFNEAVQPANKLISLYNRLSVSALDDLPEEIINNIKNKANEDFTRFDDILKFDETQANAVSFRQQLINNLKSCYSVTFNVLHPFISYSLYKTADFQRLEADARTTFQTIKDQATKLNTSLQKDKAAAQSILEEMRNFAAEHGVTQQAIYFKESADDHENQANKWQKATISVAVGLGIFAILTFFLHKIPFFSPTNNYETVQLVTSKILVFAVISYMLYLCAKVFISHKHNVIVNRHRQNALLTYKALVEAAGDTPNREVILVQAAACIFGPQGTGYTSDSVPKPPGAQSVVEFLSRPLTGSQH